MEGAIYATCIAGTIEKGRKRSNAGRLELSIKECAALCSRSPSMELRSIFPQRRMEFVEFDLNRHALSAERRNAMSKLFSPLTLRETTFKNRVFVSPMCQYSAVDGVPNDWHFVHLGSRAVGGAALVMVEATGVSPQGRISPGDTGIWNATQAEAFARIARFIRTQDSLPGIQLAHAGRKASASEPWRGDQPLNAAEGAWQTLAPSAVPYNDKWPTPLAMGEQDIDTVRAQFRAAAERALQAGFEVVEVHMAHGYLLHEFLSPLSNRRSDAYGGSLENRMRFPLAVAQAVREVWPAQKPVFVRISASDWVEGGWDLEQSIALAQALKALGIDFIDCSSGGNVRAKIPVAPGYQVPFAEAIRRQVGIATGAVGMITKAKQAEDIVAQGKADAVLLARELLRDPYWPLRAAHNLKAEIPWPQQYDRAKPADDA
jgi:2,4-dienoyl-CoA reductase-like NADH-dependent reductase (Old Yellow Enzyme family)